MGFTYVSVLVRGRKEKSVDMLVDGSTYIVLPPEDVEDLGLHETPYRVKLTLADKREIDAKLFLAEVEVKGRKGPAFIAKLETPKPLLGVYALETLGFKVNPRTGELEEISPEGGYLLIAERCMLNSWNYAKLQKFVGYKARWEGIPIVYIKAKETSTTCSRCGCDQLNQRGRVVECSRCGLALDRDINASINIAKRG